MIKLLQIANSNTNIPKPVLVRGNIGQLYKEGRVYSLVENGIKNEITEGAQRYIAMETKTATGDDPNIICYAVTRDMIFEGDLVGRSEITIGGSAGLRTDSDGHYYGVDDYLAPHILLLDIDNSDPEHLKAIFMFYF